MLIVPRKFAELAIKKINNNRGYTDDETLSNFQYIAENCFHSGNSLAAIIDQIAVQYSLLTGVATPEWHELFAKELFPNSPNHTDPDNREST